jgi:hypothetical protein
MTVTRADKAKQFRSLRHLPLPTNPILPRDLERRRRRLQEVAIVRDWSASHQTTGE